MDAGVKHEEEIVIVGGGIGGVAFALALHRVGLKSIVFEQSDALRTGGAAIALWNNAFRVLDVLGLGEKFRSQFTNLLEWKVLNARGKLLQKVVFAECEGGPHELRAVNRKVFLEALAAELPEGTIRFNARVTGLKVSESRLGFTELELQDGSMYTAKVVIGFDGINSCVGAWMGIPRAQAVGYVGIRGMAEFPNGHKFEDKAHLFVGTGSRTAYLPSSPTEVFWFLTWNDSSQGWKNMSAEQMKEEALQIINASFPTTDMPLVVSNTPAEILSKTTLRDRVNTNPESLVKGSVTVAGDAAHPTTPNMGQGGCMALEDGVMLTQKLYSALRKPPVREHEHEASAVVPVPVPEHERIHQALVEFQMERHERTNFITTRSHRIGSMMQQRWSIVSVFRDWFLIPLLINKNNFLSHTLYDVGKLPVPTSD